MIVQAPFLPLLCIFSLLEGMAGLGNVKLVKSFLKVVCSLINLYSLKMDTLL